ncbi:Transcriptional regulator, contains XRE-family HTH domain [Thalassovita litoralis]|uniref:Transcriptional regulator, contains XRE-family HTH domain n=1 Tax=Thalassovita litoralis TaxID=1010611 RepID=A0A521FCR4_9RHOB|nr:helix-turn-helix transcriptional regulator [Thalassovita litoralis]SMO93290.1 Transcriptional regulator, contains XRE-family HTH domain [Thalassovita litoralis]
MPHPVDIHVGGQLKKFRVLIGRTQTELAAALNTSFQQVQKYETGRNRISASKLFQAAQYLSQPVNSFFPEMDDAGPDEKNILSAETKIEVDLIAACRQMRNDERRDLVLKMAHAMNDECCSECVE